jgi:nucleoid DNA-binding protein
MTRSDYILKFIRDIRDLGVTIDQAQLVPLIDTFITAQANFLTKVLRNDKKLVLPGVGKIRLLNVPPKDRRKCRNPATGKEIWIKPQPASKKLTIKFLTDFRINTGAIKEKDLKAIAKREESLKRSQQLAQVKLDALSKLSPEEQTALGLNKVKKPAKKKLPLGP